MSLRVSYRLRLAGAERGYTGPVAQVNISRDPV